MEELKNVKKLHQKSGTAEKDQETPEVEESRVCSPKGKIQVDGNLTLYLL